MSSTGRISQVNLQLSLVSQMRRQQAEIARTQEEVASGRRQIDDPEQIANIKNLERSVANAERYEKSSQVLNYRLGLGETVLTSSIDLLQRARELAVMSNNDGVEPFSQSVVAAEIDSLRAQLLGLANTQDALGEYLFAGTNVTVQPFVEAGGNVIYQGDESVRQVRVAESSRLRDGYAGSRIFTDIPEGNGSFVTSVAVGNVGSAFIDVGQVADVTAWESRAADRFVISLVDDITNGLRYEVRENDGAGALVSSGHYKPGEQITFEGVRVRLSAGGLAGDTFAIELAETEDVFTTLARFSQMLRDPLGSGAQKARLSTEISRILVQLDQAINAANVARSDVGARITVLEDVDQFRTDQKVVAQEMLSTLRDTNYAESVAKLQAQMTALQVAQQAYGRATSRTLFDYL